MAVVPVEAPQLQERLRSLLETCLEDNRQAWDLHADGEWVQRKPHGEVRSTQVRLLTDSWGRSPEELRREATTSLESPLRMPTGD